MQSHIRNLALRGVVSRLVPLLVPIAIGAMAPPAAGEPSYTYHYAVAGDYADSIRLGNVPIQRDVIILYQNKFGRYPYINSTTGEFVNGGLPHLANLSEHFAACFNDIIEAIPDENWSGYGVIDYELWSPWWESTPQEYRDATIEDIQKQQPGLNTIELEQLARQKYESAARQIYEGTINLARALRPNARWGYFAYPDRRFADLENTQWLWDSCDALYPEIYMRSYLVPDNVEPGLGEANYSTYITNAFDGNLGYAREIAGGSKPVLAFAWPRYRRSNPNEWIRLRLLEPEHLKLMLVGPYVWDADGVIIWENLPHQGLADVFQEYFDTYIGPEILTMNQLVLEQDLINDQNRIREDINNDGIVDNSDLFYVIQRQGTRNILADVNKDGIVDTIDVAMVVNAFTA